MAGIIWGSLSGTSLSGTPPNGSPPFWVAPVPVPPPPHFFVFFSDTERFVMGSEPSKGARKKSDRTFGVPMPPFCKRNPPCTHDSTHIRNFRPDHSPNVDDRPTKATATPVQFSCNATPTAVAELLAEVRHWYFPCWFPLPRNTKSTGQRVAYGCGSN